MAAANEIRDEVNGLWANDDFNSNASKASLIEQNKRCVLLSKQI